MELILMDSLSTNDSFDLRLIQMASCCGRSTGAERFYMDENAPLSTSLKPVGIGWNAATVLWNETQGLGWLVADNLLSHTPASKPILDIFGLYGLTVGTLLAQKRIQIALRESEVRYRLLADNVTDVIVKTTPEGTRTFITPSCYGLLGYTPQELLGKSRFELIHPEDRAEVEATIKQAINSAKPFFPITQRIRHKDGHYLWIEVINSLIRDPDYRNGH